LTGIPHGYGQSPSAFAASLRRAFRLAARPLRGGSQAECGSRVDRLGRRRRRLLDSSRRDRDRRPASEWDARGRALGGKRVRIRIGGEAAPRLYRLWVPVRRRSQTPMRRVGTCSASSTASSEKVGPSVAESWRRYETIQPCFPQSCTSRLPRMGRASSTTCAER
jgi:hypothetical protein